MHKVAVLRDTIKATPLIFLIPFYTNVVVEAVFSLTENQIINHFHLFKVQKCLGRWRFLAVETREFQLALP